MRLVAWPSLGLVSANNNEAAQQAVRQKLKTLAVIVLPFQTAGHTRLIKKPNLLP
jgi:hypothetical protein